MEDDREVREFLVRVLHDVHWIAQAVSTAAEALAATSAGGFDLILLDAGLPDRDGFDVCRALRLRGDRTPILMLTARHAVADRVRGLDAGADDYLAKPFAVNELLARLRALARRPAAAHAPVLRLGDLTLDPGAHIAMRRDVRLVLTAREYALLECLLRSRRRIVTRTQIISHVWDDHYEPVTNAVDVLVGRLRRKIDPPGLPPLLRTVRGTGYLLTDAESPESAAREADAR